MKALVDCQSFYASCERIFRPDLVGKPIVVLSNNDHWVIALSQEAKALGMHRGQRFHEIRDLLHDNQGHYCSSNYTLYSDISRRVMITLAEVSPLVEPYSIDEAFIDLEGFSNLTEYLDSIRDLVRRQTFIPATIGAGPTKSLAKIAQRLAKKAGGSLALASSRAIRLALEQTPIANVWGIGRAHATRLLAKGISTAAQFADLDGWWVKKHMTTTGWKLHQELNGNPQLDLKIQADIRKGIVSARQFGHPVQDLETLQQAISVYTEDAWRKLRDQGSTVSVLSVSLEHSAVRGQGYGVLGTHLDQPTDYLPTLVRTAQALLTKLYHPGKEYWRTTVMFFGLEQRDAGQWDLFRPSQTRHAALMNVLESVNSRYGAKTLHLASAQIHGDWTMRREHLSPYYTTRLSDLPTVSTSRSPRAKVYGRVVRGDD
jgi:DNA polymerase V